MVPSNEILNMQSSQMMERKKTAMLTTRYVLISHPRPHSDIGFTEYAKIIIRDIPGRI
jgi:hypothetical protein